MDTANMCLMFSPVLINYFQGFYTTVNVMVVMQDVKSLDDDRVFIYKTLFYSSELN